MSQFAKRFTGKSGTVSLMEDLGNALNENPEMIFMGGGNPAQITEVEECIGEHLRLISRDSHVLHKLIGEYQPPQGDPVFLNTLANFLNEQYGWQVTAKNIAISNGGQSAFFTLFNMLGGQGEGDQQKKIVLPMAPDYLGYVDAGFDANMCQSYRPKIINIDDTLFKYQIDFERLTLNENTAAVCLSRPTNPSSNLVTDEEIDRLRMLCKERGIPLIIDAAYGKPFPGVTFTEHDIHWDENMILIFSLSKLGLPGARTGLVLASEDTIKRFSRATASLSLAPGNLGPAICRSLIESQQILPLMAQVVQPFYRQKMQQAFDYLRSCLEDLPVKIHKPEGAFFLWLWFQECPVTSEELYERLKKKGVLILSGHHFFQALGDDDWQHRHQCVRLSYCQPWVRVKRGIEILAEEVTAIYENNLTPAI
jgi:valine--pyruvate aminotransferase